MSVKHEIWKKEEEKSLVLIFQEILTSQKLYPLMSLRQLREQAVYKYCLDFDQDKTLQEWIFNRYCGEQDETR